MTGLSSSAFVSESKRGCSWFDPGGPWDTSIGWVYTRT